VSEGYINPGARMEDAGAAPGDIERAASARDASLGSAMRLAAEIVVRISSIVATLWLTRSLGVSTFGTLVLALSIGLIVAELCDLGLNAIVVPLIVRSRRNLRVIFALKATMTLGVAVLSVVLIPLAAHVSGLSLQVLTLCMIHFLGATWIEISGSALRALGRRADEALLLFTFRFALVACVVTAPFGLSLRGAAVSYAIAIAPAIVLSAILVRARSGVDEGAPPATTVQGILRYAAPMGVNGYLAIFSTRVELFLLQAFQGAGAVGLFGGAIKIVESLLTLPAAIAAGALPSVARDSLRGSRGAAQGTFGLVVWLGVPCAVGLALCAPGVLAILGPGFVDGAQALRVLAVAMFLCFGNAALFNILIAAGQTAIVPRLTAMRVSVAAGLGLLLVPFLGLSGAALSFTGAELLLFVSLVRHTRGHACIEVARPLIPAIGACIPMALFLIAWPLPLGPQVVIGAILFAASGASLLFRGAEANGLA